MKASRSPGSEWLALALPEIICEWRFRFVPGRGLSYFGGHSDSQSGAREL